MISMTIGLDLAKNIFHRVDSTGKRKKLRRRELLTHFANLPNSTIAMEACGGAHYWSRERQKPGHTTIRLPPQHVKAYARRGQKNDYNDAQAILEAAEQGRVRGVETKSIEQQDCQSLLRMRKRLIAEQTRRSNQVRGLLHDYGLIVPQGIRSLRGRLPERLEDSGTQLSGLCRKLLGRQYRRLCEMAEEQVWYDRQIRRQVKQDEDGTRLCELPGFGAIVSYAVNSWLGDGKQFRRGRDASAASGLVPRQPPSGDNVKLGGISQSGDASLRSLVVHGARSVVRQAGRKTDPLSRWIQRLVTTRDHSKAVVALANKLMRMAWVIVVRQEHYQPPAAV